MSSKGKLPPSSSKSLDNAPADSVAGISSTHCGTASITFFARGFQRILRIVDAQRAGDIVVWHRQDAHRWMQRLLRILGDFSPLELVGSHPGLEAVLTLLLQIEHGIFV